MKKWLITFCIAMVSTYAVAAGDQVQLTDGKIRFDGTRVNFTGAIKNVSNVRIKGKLCLRLYDKDDFEIDYSSSNGYLNLGLGASDRATGDISMDSNLFAQATTAKMYFGKFGCADSPSEAISEVLSPKLR